MLQIADGALERPRATYEPLVEVLADCDGVRVDQIWQNVFDYVEVVA